MGKRSNFERKELDFYATPREAVEPLIQHLGGITFCEPCAGAGDLIRHLEALDMKCVSAFDVEPRADGILRHDASWITEDDLKGADVIVTNPPWDRPVLHQIIDRCSRLRPTWLLFDADWMHTKQAIPWLRFCESIVSVGRVKWIAGSKAVGMDNCCWYLFDANSKSAATQFFGRE